MMTEVAMSALEREFLEKVAACPRPMSIGEMNQGLFPAWNEDAASALIDLGYIECPKGLAGWDEVNEALRYQLTPAGHDALGAPTPVVPAPKVPRMSAARRAKFRTN